MRRTTKYIAIVPDTKSSHTWWFIEHAATYKAVRDTFVHDVNILSADCNCFSM